MARLNALQNTKKTLRSIYHWLRDVFFWTSNSVIVPDIIRVKMWRVGGAVIGGNAVLGSGTVIVGKGKNLRIGNLPVLGRGGYLDISGKVTIGERVHIGPRFVILSMTHGIANSTHRRVRGDDIARHTRIDDGCWLGASVTVLPGVHISSGCVVAAGSVVVRDCEPNGLYAGAPAKRVRCLPIDGDADFQRRP